jgi:hypothetical protein
MFKPKSFRFTPVFIAVSFLLSLAMPAVYAQNTGGPRLQSGSVILNTSAPTTVIALQTGEEFILTDITVANRSIGVQDINLKDGDALRLSITVPMIPRTGIIGGTPTSFPTYSQTFRSGIIFTETVEAHCLQCGSESQIVITLSGRSRLRP